MRLILIRHGQTTGDIEDRYGGAYDDALSREGETQSAEMAKEFAAKGITHVYASSLKRAQQTAGILAAGLGLSVEVLADLRERDQYGPLTGMVKAEAKLKFPELAEQVKDRLNTLTGAESYADAATRMIAAFHHLAAQNHPCAAAVWHGGGMRVLFREILKRGELAGDCGDCCWVELEKQTDGWKILAMHGLTLQNA